MSKKSEIDSHLLLNDNQKVLLQSAIDNGEVVIIEWTNEQQSEAREFLKNYELLPEQITSRNTKWSHKGTKGTGKSHAQFNFVECLAYAEITIEKNLWLFRKVKGYFKHNKECKRALRIAPPLLNIHPVIKQIALDLLTLNASTTQNS
ncbi:hypothetical protein C1646_752154 [Rhizophagus diaphanus]|nr:hypothetical protein C1646_752154 [Rhizophagus diaphanus] [Rhizophagus sp. MUCL 43196]